MSNQYQDFQVPPQSSPDSRPSFADMLDETKLSGIGNNFVEESQPKTPEELNAEMVAEITRYSNGIDFLRQQQLEESGRDDDSLRRAA